MLRSTLPAVACLAALAVAQDPIRGLERAFRPAADAVAAFADRAAALDAVGPVADARTVEALVAAWLVAHRDARVAERARGRPAEHPAPAVSELRDREALDASLRLMSRIEVRLDAGRGPAVDRLVDAAFTTELPLQLRAALAPAVGRAGARVLPAVRAALAAAQRPDDTWVALRALAELGKAASEAGPDVVERLADRASIVRVQAARTVAALGHRAAAPALIARLGDEDGRRRDTVAAALEALTGESLGAAVPAWQAWWDAEGEAFVGGAPRPAPRPRPAVAPSATRGAYFGIPQDGRAVLYLVDFSKSMRARLGGADGPTRWDACVRELGDAIARLGPDRTFNIVVFAQRVVAWSDRQMPADARSVAAADAWLADLELELGTAVFEAFEVAFALGGAPLEDRYFEAPVDTIFFLSDGLPTVRRSAAPRRLAQDDPELILALVRRRNPFGAVVVHAIQLGRAGGGPLMRALAEQNGGRLVRR